MSTTLSRRFLTIIAVDAATVAIGLPAALVDFHDHSEQAEERGAVIANTGADGAYRVYGALDGTGTVVGVEVVIYSPTAQKMLESFIADELGWAPDKNFFDRYFAKTAAPEELALFKQYGALEQDNWGRFMDQAMAVDPAEEARAVPSGGGDMIVADGLLVVCDPWCLGSDYTVAVSPGTYKPVKWAEKEPQAQSFGDGTVRIGVYRDDLGIGEDQRIAGARGGAGS